MSGSLPCAARASSHAFYSFRNCALCLALCLARLAPSLTPTHPPIHHPQQSDHNQNLAESRFVADAKLLNALLSVQSLSHPHRFRGHIVAQLQNPDIKHRFQMVAGARTYFIIPSQIIPQLMIKCSRQSALPELYSGVYGFEGSEFYLKHWRELPGLTFADARRLIQRCIVVGYKPHVGPAVLNPEDRYEFTTETGGVTLHYL